MEKEKLKLKEIKIQSFVTDLKEDNPLSEIKNQDSIFSWICCSPIDIPTFNDPSCPPACPSYEIGCSTAIPPCYT